VLRDNEKVTDIITGEALLSLLREKASVSTESLAARLQQFLRLEEDADRCQSILAALRMISTLSVHHESHESYVDNSQKTPMQIFYWSFMMH